MKKKIENNITAKPEVNTGSFRDPMSRVYEIRPPALDGGAPRVLRGMSAYAFEIFQRLSGETFFQKFIETGHVVKTNVPAASDESVKTVLVKGWSGVIEHEPVPFITYPYEWTFSMLKDAALLQLHLIEKSLENGWTLKDATPYNIQWTGSRPVFIDIPSFEPWVEGEPWVGYRQFCSMFLTPLLMKAHLGIDYLPLLRSWIDGIPPTEAVKYFQGLNRYRKGVLSHIIFPAKVENMIAKRERDDAPAKERGGRKQSKAMILGLLQSLSRLVGKLDIEIAHTDWSQYYKTHSYQEADFEAKKSFVKQHASAKPRSQVWDLGCNTGTFSRLCGEFCNQVISIDGDHDAVEQLYRAEKGNGHSNILPMVMNLSNISPSQGWAGKERVALDRRMKPDLVLCLALIHHVRLSANIPNVMFLEWLRSLDADVIIEFVNRRDEMVVKLLTNKKQQYDDYNLEQFIGEAERFFEIRARAPLKGGKREIFFLVPRRA